MNICILFQLAKTLFSQLYNEPYVSLVLTTDCDGTLEKEHNKNVAYSNSSTVCMFKASAIAFI